MTEKQILSGIEHPFLVKLKLSFQDDRNYTSYSNIAPEVNSSAF